jgi:hypothetical protein
VGILKKRVDRKSGQDLKVNLGIRKCLQTGVMICFLGECGTASAIETTLRQTPQVIDSKVCLGALYDFSTDPQILTDLI